MRTRPRRWASSFISRARSLDSAIGFSTTTCLPAANAFIASGWWVRAGVAIATASIEGSARTSSMSVKTGTPPTEDATCCALAASRSTIAASSQNGEEVKLRARFGPQ